MKKIVSEHEVDTLVHCAANAREGASQFQPYSVCQRNLAAYGSILSACIAAGVKKVVLFSSMAIYGDQTPPFDERLPAKPIDVYAVNKHAMEETTRILAGVHGFAYTIIRPHNVFGERQALNDIHRNVIAIFMNRIMRGESLFIYGDGEQCRAFSYIYDSLPCFLEVVLRGASDVLNQETINIGGTTPITINELAHNVKTAMGVPNHLIEYLPDRPCEAKEAFTTHQKSVDLLGYEESTGWARGIHAMAAWAKERGPQQWQNTDKLELITDDTPQPWVEVENGSQ
jgi:UDP-glucose 4-epimerase